MMKQWYLQIGCSGEGGGFSCNDDGGIKKYDFIIRLVGVLMMYGVLFEHHKCYKLVMIDVFRYLL